MLITTIRKPPNQGNNCHLVRYKSQPVKNHVIQTKTHQSLDPLLETLRNSGRQSLSKVSGYEADATSWRDWSPDRTSWRVSILLSLVQTELRLRRSPGSHQSLISVSSSLVCAPSGRSEQTGSKSEPRDPESEPNMGQMGEGEGGQWSEHYPSHVTSGTRQGWSPMVSTRRLSPEFYFDEVLLASRTNQ